MNDYAVSFFKALKPVERKAIAQRCGIKRTYLNNLITCKDRVPSVVLAAKLESATNGRITRRDIRPDIDWKLIEGQY
ncbi:MAG: helix-turn-helix domain-containing protein [Duodenibacillus sp.]|nr:helix-turn-helix domain-containing protein [Duodenibacillus sp.]